MTGLIIIAMLVLVMLVIAWMLLCELVPDVEVISREFWEDTKQEFRKDLRRFQNLEHV